MLRGRTKIMQLIFGWRQEDTAGFIIVILGGEPTQWKFVSIKRNEEVVQLYRMRKCCMEIEIHIWRRDGNRADR